MSTTNSTSVGSARPQTASVGSVGLRPVLAGMHTQNTALAKALRNTPDLRPLDLHLARFATSMDATPNSAVLVATALASRAIGAGDVCAELADCITWATANPEHKLPLEAATWREALLNSNAVHAPAAPAEQGSEPAPAAATAATPREATPLILDSADRLYIARYYGDEQFVADTLRRIQADSAPLADAAAINTQLDRFFPPAQNAAGEAIPDWQRSAVAVALRQRFTVISGGPGTGKTRTVARLLCLAQHFATEPLRIALTAPTGKAAARLSQSIQRELPAIAELLPEAAAQVPTDALTLHRLLGYRGDGSYRHGQHNPLSVDLLLVDEASMLDLAMMARLLKAVPPQARLVLLGDRDQLSSVEAGNVLGDICADHFDSISDHMQAYLQQVCPVEVPQLQLSDHPLADGISLLRHSYRFRADSAVGGLASALNSGDWPGVQRWLQADDPAMQYLPPSAESQQLLNSKVVKHFRALLKCSSASEALSHLSGFQLLCALRRGPAGVDELNAQLAQGLRRAGLVTGSGEHYPGRPIMVQQNDYAQGLYNGDVGLLWPDDTGDLRAWFEDGEGGVRSVMPARLPSHESCYAMTVHKTQGSEFLDICIVLPEQPAPILSRQLLYTGVTRARESLSLYGSIAVIKSMVQTPIKRRSGLRDALSQSTVNSSPNPTASPEA